MESGFSSSAGSTLFRDQVDPVFSFPMGSWSEKKAAFPCTLLPSIYLFFYAFVRLSVARRCQVVLCFLSPPLALTPHPELPLSKHQILTWKLSSMVYCMCFPLRTLVWSWSCLGLSLCTHGTFLCSSSFRSLSFVLHQSCPVQKRQPLFMVQIRGFQIDTGSLFEMAWGLPIGWVAGNIFI